MNASQYRRALRPYLNARRHRDDRSVVAHLSVHMVLIVTTMVAAALYVDTLHWAAVLAMAVFAGHSGLVVAFAAHEITHGVGGLSRRWRAIVEPIAWLPTLFAVPTTQRKAHNVLHHGHTNAANDPDRRLTLSEVKALGPVARLATWLIPNRRHPLVTAIHGFSFSIFSYHNSILWHSLLQTGELYDTRLTSRQRRRAAREFTVSAGLWIGLWALSGFSGLMLAALCLMYFTTTTIAAMYIATNHLLNGLVADENDPLATTVSVRVPRWVDWLHLNFSHHVAHHLYPTAGYKDLPAVRTALREHFPDRYTELPWPVALRMLFTVPLAMADANTLVDVDGSAPVTVPFPVASEGA